MSKVCFVKFVRSRRVCISSSVESSFLLRQRFTPRQLSKDNRPIVLLLFLTFLHAKDIWRNIHIFQRGISCKFHAEGYAKKSLVRQENNSRSIEFNEITVITIK